MKYLEQGGFQQKSLMRLTLGLMFLFLSAFWATSWAMYLQRMSFTTESIIQHYRGNEELFQPAMNVGTMIETSHMHMPMMGMVLLFLTHLLIFVPISRRSKIIFIVLTFVSALLDEGSGWLVRFIHPAFAPLKIIGFLGLQTCIAFLISAIAWFLWTSANEQKKEREQEEDEVISAP